MKVYIATAFKNAEAFHKMKDFLEAEGHIITHDWTKEDASAFSGEEKELYLMGCAGMDLLAITDSDALVFMAHPKMAGAYVELGFALGMSKPVILVDAFKDGNPDCIFYYLPQCGCFQHVNNWNDILAILSAGYGATPYEKISGPTDFSNN